MLESPSGSVTAAEPAPAGTLPASLPLGSRGLRLAAVLIDVLVILFPVFFISALSGSVAFGAVLYLVVSWLYAPLLLLRSGSDNGQTIGKETLGLRVVSLEEERITPHTAFLRELVGRSLLNLVTLGLYGLVDSAWCLFDPRKQTLHDKIAHTIVVRAPRGATAVPEGPVAS